MIFSLIVESLNKYSTMISTKIGDNLDFRKKAIPLFINLHRQHSHFADLTAVGCSIAFRTRCKCDSLIFSRQKFHVCPMGMDSCKLDMAELQASHILTIDTNSGKTCWQHLKAPNRTAVPRSLRGLKPLHVRPAYYRSQQYSRRS